VSASFSAADGLHRVALEDVPLYTVVLLER
jgi:hypothetical protein